MRSLRIHPLVASTLVKGFLQSFEDLGYMSRKQEYEGIRRIHSSISIGHSDYLKW
ncbi:unnamed protein product [Brassica rapa subsp. trilocularis]